KRELESCSNTLVSNTNSLRCSVGKRVRFARALRPAGRTAGWETTSCGTAGAAGGLSTCVADELRPDLATSACAAGSVGALAEAAPDALLTTAFLAAVFLAGVCFAAFDAELFTAVVPAGFSVPSSATLLPRTAGDSDAIGVAPAALVGTASGAEAARLASAVRTAASPFSSILTRSPMRVGSFGKGMALAPVSTMRWTRFLVRARPAGRLLHARAHASRAIPSAIHLRR